MKLYGQETAKSLLNFPPFSLVNYEFIKSIILIKKAATIANYELSVLPEKKFKAIVGSCNLLLSGKHKDQFITDSMQGGAGTSINMNANEVIANLASSSKEKVHPLDDVNKSQSTNDVLPTALRITLLNLYDDLEVTLNKLAITFGSKAKSFKGIKKVGRTHLQDAVEIALSDEWAAYSKFSKRSAKRIHEAKAELLITNLGGTAIGTKVGTPKGYVKLVHKHLSKLTGYKLTPSGDLVDATQNIDAFIVAQHALTTLAGGLSKIASDLRLLGSGPKAGIGELKLPEVQKGSTIMPGKVNPVILEYVNQVAFDILGKTHTIEIIQISGQLELNVYFPLLAKNLIESTILLANAVDAFTKYASKIEVDKIHCEELFQKSIISGVDRAIKVGYEKSEKEVKSKLNQK
jgi:aspartate ammonia-lyase